MQPLLLQLLLATPRSRLDIAHIIYERPLTLKSRSKFWQSRLLPPFAAVGGVRAVRVAAHGRGAGDARADRRHQAAHRVLPPTPPARQDGRR